MKIRVFVGSASEDLNIANAISQHLEPEFDCVVWNEPGVFKLSDTPLTSILEEISNFDVGIFVFGAHDATVSRDKNSIAARDNVVFEHGLFAGRLGANRAIVIRDRRAELKWPSDLMGFTPVFYDDEEAKKDAKMAVRNACDEIKRHLKTIAPVPCISLSNKRRAISRDWWTYGLAGPAKEDPATLSSTYVGDADGFEFDSHAEIGVKFPRSDSLNESPRYCAFRIKGTHVTGNRRIYVALKASETDRLLGQHEKYLQLSDSNSSPGWASPNEFKVTLPDLTDGQWHKIVVDFLRFEPFIGESVAIRGFRLRRGLKLSHICTFETKPNWLNDAEEISPDGAPHISIVQPKHGQTVNNAVLAEGQFTHSASLQAAVFSGGKWHRQSNVVVGPAGHWSVQCSFGKSDDAYGTHRLAVLTGENPIQEPTPTLPSARGRACIEVHRR
jgi:hypothetical protein